MAAGDVLWDGASGYEWAVVEVPTSTTPAGIAKAAGVVILNAAGVATTPLVGYTEDAASAADPIGPMTMLRRRDALVTTEVSTTGDNIAWNATNRGEGVVAQIGVAYTDRSIASLAGSSETLMAANTARRILIVYNIGATAIAVNLTGGAASLTAGGSVVIAAGGSLILDSAAPTALIKIIGTASAAVTAYEG